LTKRLQYMNKVKPCSFCGNDGTKPWMCRECPIEVINNSTEDKK
jgi:hypothetical protein